MSLILVLDFDGTVTRKDVGDEVCNRFAPPEWRAIDDAWVRNEISLPDAHRQMWGLARCTREQALACSREVGEVRGGLDQFLDAAAGAGGRLWLASGGFDFYIEAILGERAARFEPGVLQSRPVHRRSGSSSIFIKASAATNAPSAKGRVCEPGRRGRRARVVFVGDGASDRCAIGKADLVCAVEGSMLARGCAERGVEHRTFSDFHTSCSPSSGFGWRGGRRWPARTAR